MLHEGNPYVVERRNSSCREDDEMPRERCACGDGELMRETGMRDDMDGMRDDVYGMRAREMVC